MNGAEAIVQTLVDSGVDVCFANPGTSEMHFLAALDQVTGMKPILGLFEGVVTGMADGYGRMSGRPACTLLHLGPGLANGLANLHNARRAATPIVNIVGDHATYHAQYDAPLASDVAGLARWASAWVETATSAGIAPGAAARAVAASRAGPGQTATLILPADVAWTTAEGPARAPDRPRPAQVPSHVLTRVAESLGSINQSAILMRGDCLQPRGLEAASRVAVRTGARLLCDTFAPRIARGAGRPPIERLPYFAEQIVEALKDVRLLVLVGAKPPVSFFAYPGKPSWCLPAEAKVLHLAQTYEDGVEALEGLADLLGASGIEPQRASMDLPDRPSGKFNQYTIGQSIARHLPENAIFSDEAATTGLGTTIATVHARPHDHLALTGGAIGQGIPLATGAAVASTDRKVVCLQGDGGAMYTIQALWTQARERLDVTTVIVANRSYAILNVEMARVGAGEIGRLASSMLSLTNPNLDFVKMARGLGVEATRVDTIDAFDDQFGSAMRNAGPRLIEAVI